MSFTLTFTPGKTFQPGEKIDNDKLNQLGQPTATITGTGSGSDFADGAITAAKSTAGPFFYADNGSTYGASGIAKTGKYRLGWSSNTPPVTPIAEGTIVAWRVVGDNQGSVSIDWVNGTEWPLYKGPGTTLDLVRGDLVTGQIVEMRFFNNAWQLLTAPTFPWGWYQGTDSGSSNAYIVALTPPAGTITSLAIGDIAGKTIRFKAANANTATSTLVVQIGSAAAFVAKTIYKNKGTALVAGDILANQIVDVVYEATTDSYQMVSPPGNPAPIVVSGVDAGATDTYAITSTPTIGAYTAGLVVVFKANTVNTGAATLNVNGIGNKPIVTVNGIALTDSTIKAGQWVTVVYDLASLSFILVSPKSQWSNATSGNNMATSDHAIAHGLGAVPTMWKMVGVCTSNDAGFTAGDEVDINAFQYSAGSPVLAVTVWADATNVGCSFNTTVGAPNYLLNKNAGGTSTVDRTKWKPKAYWYA